MIGETLAVPAFDRRLAKYGQELFVKKRISPLAQVLRQH